MSKKGHSSNFKSFIKCDWWLNDGTYFPHKFLLIDTQVLRLCKAFANGSSVKIRFLKTWLSKMVQLEGFLGRLLGPLMKFSLPLMKNTVSPLPKSVLVPLGLTAAMSAKSESYSKELLLY